METTFAVVSSPLQVAQLALACIGSDVALSGTGTVPAIPDDTKEGDVCAKFYDLARRAVLSAFDWNFARWEVGLAATVDDRDPPQGWGHLYLLPDGTLYDSAPPCVEPRRLWNGIRREASQGDLEIPFERWDGLNGEDEDEDQKQAIVCDLEDDEDTGAPFLTYTADISGDSQGAGGLRRWPDYFVDAVVWELAARIAMPLTQDVKKAQLAMGMAQQKLREGMAREKGAKRADPAPQSEFFTSRS